MLRVAYPMLYQNAGAQEVEDAVDLWSSMFADDDPNLVVAAARAFIATDTKGYPPHIGAIKEKMRVLTKKDMPTPLEAWNDIWDSLKKKNWRYEEVFNGLPPIVRSIVGSSNTLRRWGSLPSDTTETVISSNFQKAYRDRVREKQEYDALPQDIRGMYESNGRAKYLNGNSEPELPPAKKRYVTTTGDDGEEITVEVT